MSGVILFCPLKPPDFLVLGREVGKFFPDFIIPPGAVHPKQILTILEIKRAGSDLHASRKSLKAVSGHYHSQGLASFLVVGPDCCCFQVGGSGAAGINGGASVLTAQTDFLTEFLCGLAHQYWN